MKRVVWNRPMHHAGNRIIPGLIRGDVRATGAWVEKRSYSGFSPFSVSALKPHVSHLHTIQVIHVVCCELFLAFFAHGTKLVPDWLLVYFFLPRRSIYCFFSLSNVNLFFFVPQELLGFFIAHRIITSFTVFVTMWQHCNELKNEPGCPHLYSQQSDNYIFSLLLWLLFSPSLSLFLLPPLLPYCHMYIHALIQKIGENWKNCHLNLKSISILHALSLWPYV